MRDKILKVIEKNNKSLNGGLKMSIYTLKNKETCIIY